MTRYEHTLMCGCKFVSSKWLDVAHCGNHKRSSAVAAVSSYVVDQEGRRITPKVRADRNGEAS